MQSLAWLQKYWLKSGVHMTQLKEETQNEEYEGLTFTVDGETFRSRLAKKTPKKKGYFVVFWEKDTQNKNQPYDYEEAPEQLLVTVIDQEKQGVFIFPKDVLLQQGILSGAKSKGKMGIRVYPTWETELNSRAQRTQKWQAIYFKEYSTK